MSVTLITLMVIQVYWIKNAVMVKHAIFSRNVSDAVTKAVYNIERIDRANMIRIKKNSLRSSHINFLNRKDSLNLYLLNNFSSFGHSAVKEPFLTAGIRTSHLVERMFNIPSRDMQLVENRVSKKLIDSLLKIEFRAAGLNTKYEFGVYSPTRNKLVLQKTGKYPKELLESSFRYLLFPGEIFSPQNLLMIYFPNERQYVITRIWFLLASSVVLILAIIFSFTYVVTTVFRQKKLSEIKNDFINNMTHEFKTPISTISLACQALSDKDIVKNSAVYDSYISIIDEENSRLQGMAERILQSARLQKGEIVLKLEKINLHDVLRDAIQKVSMQIEKKGGKITMELNAENPDIVADRVHITNIIFNLLDNANKYTPWAPIIFIRTQNINKGILFSIKDNGIGISGSNQKKVFDKLFRVPTGNVHDVKGFGLGLSYVKTIVEKHNGKITLDSELNKGSTFSVYLPLN